MRNLSCITARSHVDKVEKLVRSLRSHFLSSVMLSFRYSRDDSNMHAVIVPIVVNSSPDSGTDTTSDPLAPIRIHDVIREQLLSGCHKDLDVLLTEVAHENTRRMTLLARLMAWDSELWGLFHEAQQDLLACLDTESSRAFVAKTKEVLARWTSSEKSRMEENDIRMEKRETQSLIDELGDLCGDDEV